MKEEPGTGEFRGSDSETRRSLLWSLVGLGMLVIITVVASWTLRKVDETSRWVEHTQEVTRVTDQLLEAVKDAESGQRGYLLTGNAAYLQPYYDALKATPDLIARLRNLTQDNPQQQTRINALQPLIADRLTALGDVIHAQNTSGPDAARNMILNGPGRPLMVQIREVGQQIQEEESRLLRQRSEARQASLRNGYIATVVASILALVALISAATDLRRATRLRGVAEREKAESESTTRALFEAAAQAIFIVRQDGTIVMANPAAEKVLGYSREELLGSSIEMLIPEGLRNVHRRHRTNYFENPQNRAMGQGLDLHARRKNGSEFFADISLSYIKTANETLGVAFLTDISKRREDEKAIRDQKDDLRHLAANLMTAQDDERRRIARDLHDETSQKLAYLAMDAGKLAASSQDQELTNRLRVLQKRATEASDSVRRISHRLHPSILDDIGLEAAVEQYCEEFQERSGIVTNFSSNGVPIDLSRDVASSVYHIFQECLRNVSKHAKTERVMVTLEGDDDYLRLIVRDQGIGLSETQQKSGATIGLTGMKERALLINGTLTIRSQRGKGTEVMVAVPLSA